MKKRLAVVLLGFILISALYLIGSGFSVREDVYLEDFIAAPYQNEMTIDVGVASSAGYTRSVKNVSDDPEIMRLQFYSAYGGINGSIGENHRFVIDPPPECKEIHFSRHDAFELVLYKNGTTGEWESVR